MKKILLILFFLICACGQAGLVSGEKIQILSSDYLSESNIQKKPLAAQTIPTQQIPNPQSNLTTSSVPILPQTTASAALTPLPDIKLPAVQKGPIDIKKIKITVPDYEKKYRQMFEAELTKRERKKKGIVDSILDEIVKYGVYIVFAFVILTVFFTLRREQIKQKELLSVHSKPDQTEDTKDIWREDF